MDGVNRPGSGQRVPPADDSENKENTPPKNEQKSQTGFGERPKKRSLKDRLTSKNTDGDGPSVRSKNTPSKEDGEDV